LKVSATIVFFSENELSHIYKAERRDGESEFSPSRVRKKEIYTGLKQLEGK